MKMLYEIKLSTLVEEKIYYVVGSSLDNAVKVARGALNSELSLLNSPTPEIQDISVKLLGSSSDGTLFEGNQR